LFLKAGAGRSVAGKLLLVSGWDLVLAAPPFLPGFASIFAGLRLPFLPGFAFAIKKFFPCRKKGSFGPNLPLEGGGFNFLPGFAFPPNCWRSGGKIPRHGVAGVSRNFRFWVRVGLEMRFGWPLKGMG
jgi:hypothetical protein